MERMERNTAARKAMLQRIAAKTSRPRYLGRRRREVRAKDELHLEDAPLERCFGCEGAWGTARKHTCVQRGAESGTVTGSRTCVRQDRQTVS